MGYLTFKYRIMYSTNPTFGTVNGYYDSYATWYAWWSYDEGCALDQVNPMSSTITYLNPSTTYYIKIHAYVAQAYHDGCEAPYFNPSDGSAQLVFTYPVFSGTTTASGGGGGGGGGGGCGIHPTVVGSRVFSEEPFVVPADRESTPLSSCASIAAVFGALRDPYSVFGLLTLAGAALAMFELRARRLRR